MTIDITIIVYQYFDFYFANSFIHYCAGTHWVFNMVQMLRTNTTEYTGTPEVMELHPIDDMATIKAPRMYLTHLTYPFIPTYAKDGKVKVIHVLRNPKDIVLSFYEFFKNMINTSYEGTFDGFLKYFLSEECKYF